MNALQTFLEAHPCGFLTDKDIPELVKLHRLCMCLIRFRGKSEGRFLCSAQYVADMVSMLHATGRYVRDVSVSTSEIDAAASWKPEPSFPPEIGHSTGAANSLGSESNVKAFLAKRREPIEGQDWICTGNFDGSTCGTDADPGL